MRDFILNGQGHGSVAATLLANDFDIRCMRPWLGDNGRSYMTKIHNGKPIVVPLQNAVATLRKDEWKLLDQTVIRSAKERLQAVADLRGAGLTFNIPNGLSKSQLDYETQSDISPAIISMDGLRESDSDRPVYDLKSLPLPIIHKDFQFSARQVAISRNGSTPLDTTTAELAGEAVAEEAEKLLLGVSSSYSYGGNTIYGYTNFPSRMTKSMTLPTAPGWTPSTTVQEVLGMRQQSHNAFHRGPWRLYTSPNWDEYLDDDYSAAKGDNTLRDRLLKLRGINSVDTLDHLTNFQMLLVQQSRSVVRMVIGMDVVTLQWESHGGMQLNYKVMTIMVPQLRTDHNGNTGIVHGTAS